MSVEKGDVVLTKDHFIGVVRYVGPISKFDHNNYIGIEIQHKKDSNSQGNTNGRPYFETVDNNGLFVREGDIIRKYSAIQFFQFIQQQIPPDVINKFLLPDVTPIGDNINDLQRLKTNLLSLSVPNNEIDTLIKFCDNEGYDDFDIVQCDIEEYDMKENESIIMEHMQEEYGWSATKQEQFVTAINKALNMNNASSEEMKVNDSSSNNQSKKPKPRPVTPPPPMPSAPPTDLPSIYDFKIPKDMVKQKDNRTARDIVSIMNRNKVPNEYTSKLRSFFNSNNVRTFDQLQNTEIMNIFTSMHPELKIFQTYIDKCIYELSELVFLQRKIEKKDELQCKQLLDEQCSGLIKHDKPLIHFILLTQFTSHELPSEIVDIADRIYIEERRKLSNKVFSQKPFFRNINIKQKSTVSLGLTHYHHRFLPEFPHRPIKYVVDKISGYQKYCILLSHVISTVCNRPKPSNQNDPRFNFSSTRGWSVSNAKGPKQKPSTHGSDIGCLPLHIDMMIIPPGCQDRVEDLKYDALGPSKTVGDIAKKLEAFNISFEKMQGLKAKYSNFDEGIGRRIAKPIVNAINKFTKGFTESHQRVCIVVDRRWRIHCKNEWIGYDKLKKSASQIDLSRPWYKQKSDTIYVFSPNLASKAKKTYHEFQKNYIHETLLYLTKRCIVPNVNGQHIGGDTPDGWLFNISAHIERSKQPRFYRCNQRWYIFLQGAAIRFFPNDMVKLWNNYFANVDEDKGRMGIDRINKEFKIDLTESDCSYKRWYGAIKRSD